MSFNPLCLKTSNPVVYMLVFLPIGSNAGFNPYGRKAFLFLANKMK
jgi:hypothetical protein